MRSFKVIATALALPGLMAASAVEAAATRSVQIKPKMAVNSRPVCAPGMVLRQSAVRQGYAPLRCIQPDPPNDGGMGTRTAERRVRGRGLIIVGALAAAGVGLGIAVGSGGNDSPGG